MARMEIREEEVHGEKLKRVVVKMAGADALKIEAYARQQGAIHRGTIYVEFTVEGDTPFRAELPTDRIKRHMGRVLDRYDRQMKSSEVAAA